MGYTSLDNKGGKFFPFSQNEILHPEDLGVCYGLSTIMAQAISEGGGTAAQRYLANLNVIASGYKSDLRINSWKVTIDILQRQMNQRMPIRRHEFGHDLDTLFDTLNGATQSITYKLGTHNHAMSIMVQKEGDKTTYFFFDPNYGLMEHPDFELFKQYVQLYLKKTYGKDVIDVLRKAKVPAVGSDVIVGKISHGMNKMEVGLGSDKLGASYYFLQDDGQPGTRTFFSDINRIDYELSSRYIGRGWNLAATYELRELTSSDFDEIGQAQVKVNGQSVALSSFWHLDCKQHVPWSNSAVNLNQPIVTQKWWPNWLIKNGADEAFLLKHDIYEQVLQHYKTTFQLLEEKLLNEANADFNNARLYECYQKVTVPGYASTSSLLDLYKLAVETSLTNEELGALSRHIHIAYREFRYKAVRDIVQENGRIHDVFQKHFKLGPRGENASWIGPVQEKIYSQRFLLATDNSRSKGYCYALSWAMAAAIDQDPISGDSVLLERIIKSTDYFSSLGSEELRNVLSKWNSYANEHYNELLTKGLVSAKTLNDIKSQLASAATTSMYELNTPSHAMMIGVTVDSSNNRQYYFYDPELGSMRFNSVHELFIGLKSYFNDANQRTQYHIPADFKFEFIPIDTHGIAKNMWVLDVNTIHVVHSLNTPPEWRAALDPLKASDIPGIKAENELPLNLMEGTKKGTVVAVANTIAVLAGGGEGAGLIAVVDIDKAHIAGIQHILRLAVDASSHTDWLTNVKQTYSFQGRELELSLNKMSDAAGWFTHLKNRIQQNGFVFINSDLSKAGEWINLKAAIGNTPVSTIYASNIVMYLKNGDFNWTPKANVARLANVNHFYENMSALSDQGTKLIHSSDGPVMYVLEGIDTIKRHHADVTVSMKSSFESAHAGLLHERKLSYMRMRSTDHEQLGGFDGPTYRRMQSELANILNQEKSERMRSRADAKMDFINALGGDFGKRLKSAINLSKKGIKKANEDKLDRSKLYQADKSRLTHEFYDSFLFKYEERYHFNRPDIVRVLGELSAYLQSRDGYLSLSDDGDYALVMVKPKNSEAFPISRIDFNNSRFEKISDGQSERQADGTSQKVYSDVYVHKSNGREYIQDAHRNFVPRYITRYMSAYDDPINQGFKSRNGQMPSGDDVNSAILSHLRAAQQGKSYYISFTTTQNSIFGSTGTDFYFPTNGQVIVDLAKIKQADIYDVHAIPAIIDTITEKDLRWDLKYNPEEQQQTLDYEKNAAARDTVRTRELVIHGEVPKDAIVQMRKAGQNEGNWVDFQKVHNGDADSDAHQSYVNSEFHSLTHKILRDFPAFKDKFYERKPFDKSFVDVLMQETRNSLEMKQAFIKSIQDAYRANNGNVPTNFFTDNTKAADLVAQYDSIVVLETSERMRHTGFFGYNSDTVKGRAIDILANQRVEQAKYYLDIELSTLIQYAKESGGGGVSDQPGALFLDLIDRYQALGVQYEFQSGKYTSITADNITDYAQSMVAEIFANDRPKYLSEKRHAPTRQIVEAFNLAWGLHANSQISLERKAVVQAMEKHGVADITAQSFATTAQRLSQLEKKSNKIFEQVQELDTRLTQDHILVHDATVHKQAGDLTLNFVHKSGNSAKNISVDVLKAKYASLIEDIQKVHQGYKKLAPSPGWTKAIDKLDDWSGYIGLVNQWRVVAMGKLFEKDASFTTKALGYTQVGLATTQTATQLVTKLSARMAKSSELAAGVSKSGAKLGKILPVVGVSLEAGTLAISVTDLAKIWNDPHASNLEKGNAAANALLSLAGLGVSVVAVGAMLMGATLVASAATGVGLLLIPITAGIGLTFDYYRSTESTEQAYQYIECLAQAYQTGYHYQDGTLSIPHGVVVGKINLRGSGSQLLEFIGQTIKGYQTDTETVNNQEVYYASSSKVNILSATHARSQRDFNGVVTTLVLPTAVNQILEYNYAEGIRIEHIESVDAKSTPVQQRLINKLDELGIKKQYKKTITQPSLTGGRHVTEQKSLNGIQVVDTGTNPVEVFLDKQVKHIYTPMLDKSMTYNLQGDGGHYLLTLADKGKFLLSENEDLASTWMLDSSYLIEKDDIQFEGNKLIIGKVEIDVSKSPKAKLMIQRSNGDIATIDLARRTKTINQMTFQQYESRKNILTADLLGGSYHFKNEDPYVLIKNYKDNGKHVGNAYHNTTTNKLIFSSPAEDVRPLMAQEVMGCFDEMMKDPALYEIERDLQQGKWVNEGAFGSGDIVTVSAYAYKLKERKASDIEKLKGYIEDGRFKKSYISLYDSIKHWLMNYEEATKKISAEVSSKSKQWDANVTVKKESRDIINVNAFQKSVNSGATHAVSQIKVQQANFQLLYEQTQQLNPLYNALFGGVDGDNYYFYNGQSAIAWRTNRLGVIQEQYVMPLSPNDWDYTRLSIRQASNTQGEKVFFFDVVARSLTGTTSVVKTRSYHIGVGKMELLLDYTDRSEHTHPVELQNKPTRFEFANVVQTQWVESPSVVHHYNETDPTQNYWMLGGQQVYADLPSGVDVKVWKSMRLGYLPASENKAALFYFHDSINQKLYQQEGDGTMPSSVSPRAKLVGTATLKMTNFFVFNGFVWATNDAGVTYQVTREGTLGDIARVELNPVWLSAAGKTDWISWLKADLLGVITEKWRQTEILGIKSVEAEGKVYAWYEEGKVYVIDQGNLSLVSLDHAGTKAYLLDQKTGELYQQARSEIAAINNLDTGGYKLKNQVINNRLLPNWIFSKASVLDWREVIDGQDALNQLLLLDIQKEAGDKGILQLLWDVRNDKMSLKIANPLDLKRHSTLLAEIDTLILGVPDSADVAYTYDLNAHFSENTKLKLIVIEYDNARTDKSIFDQIRYAVTAVTKFGRIGDDLFFTSDRGTVQVKYAFDVDLQEQYKQLKFTISGAPASFSASVWDLVNRLNDAKKLNLSDNFYQWTYFVNNNQLVVHNKDEKAKDLIGSKNNDSLVGNELDNSLYGLEGDDTLSGHTGNDKIYGDQGRDNLLGGVGDDELSGGENNDELYGDEGDDKLWGDHGDDTLYGGVGKDRLCGGMGKDKLYGGADNDTYIFRPEDGVDVIEDAIGIDAIYFVKGAGNNSYTFERSTNDLIIYYGNKDQVQIKDHFDSGQSKSIEKIAFQNGITIDLSKRSEWFGIFSSEAIFKKEGDDLLISDSGDTYRLKHVLGSGEKVCDQLMLGLGGARYSPTLLLINQLLNSAEATLNQHQWYELKGFLKEGILIHRGQDGKIQQMIALQDHATLIGDSADNTLYSKAGTSVLDGSKGADMLCGNLGDDTYRFRDGDGVDTVVDSGGSDTLEFASGVQLTKLKREQNDLLVYYGLASSVRVKNHFNVALSSVEHLKLTGGQNYQIADLVRQAVQLAPSSLDSWEFSLGELAAGASSTVQVDPQESADTPSGTYSDETVDFSQWKGPKQPAAEGTDLRVDLQNMLWHTHNNQQHGTINANIANIIGSIHNEHFAGDDQSNEIYGGGGRDVFEGGKGDDLLTDGTSRSHSIVYGNSTYQFDAGDGDDQIWDWGGLDDKISLMNNFSNDAHLSFYREEADLLIKYNEDEDGAMQNSIRIHGHFNNGRGVEKLLWGGNTFDLTTLSSQLPAEVSALYTLAELESAYKLS